MFRRAAGELLVGKATISLKRHSGIEHGPRCTSEVAHYKSSKSRDWGLLLIFLVKTNEVLVKERKLSRAFFEIVIDVSLFFTDDITQQDLIDAKTHLDKFLVLFVDCTEKTLWIQF